MREGSKSETRRGTEAHIARCVALAMSIPAEDLPDLAPVQGIGQCMMVQQAQM